MSKRCGMWSVYRWLVMGGRGGSWWPVLSEHWLSYTGCWRYLPSMKWLMYGILFLHLSTSPWCFCPRTIFAKKNNQTKTIKQQQPNNKKKRLDKLPRTSFIPDLLIIQGIINRSVPYFTTDSPCGVCGVWMNHLPPVWWSTFRYSFFLNGNRCVSLVWWRGILLLAFCLNSCFIHYAVLPNIFPLFYAKNFVLSFSIDLVATFFNKQNLPEYHRKITGWAHKRGFYWRWNILMKFE